MKENLIKQSNVLQLDSQNMIEREETSKTRSGHNQNIKKKKKKDCI